MSDTRAEEFARAIDCLKSCQAALKRAAEASAAAADEFRKLGDVLKGVDLSAVNE
ncbi:hypothetical protein LCGC14_0663260 [marine sediment metagenome]|uniref:Uncharacterized protein n=1 Tax=marine sediment metagenome TaxID=412755 RepID=A0A0F9U1A1_9ZZZZ